VGKSVCFLVFVERGWGTARGNVAEPRPWMFKETLKRPNMKSSVHLVFIATSLIICILSVLQSLMIISFPSCEIFLWSLKY
jgi:hypothetical protein